MEVGVVICGVCNILMGNSNRKMCVLFTEQCGVARMVARQVCPHSTTFLRATYISGSISSSTFAPFNKIVLCCFNSLLLLQG